MGSFSEFVSTLPGDCLDSNIQLVAIFFDADTDETGRYDTSNDARFFVIKSDDQLHAAIQCESPAFKKSQGGEVDDGKRSLSHPNVPLNLVEHLFYTKLC